MGNPLKKKKKEKKKEKEKNVVVDINAQSPNEILQIFNIQIMLSIKSKQFRSAFL